MSEFFKLFAYSTFHIVFVISYCLKYQEINKSIAAKAFV